MAAATDDDDQTTDNSRTDTEQLRNGAQSAEEYDPLDALRGLAPGARVTVHRQTPSYAKGFLDHLTIPQTGEIDIESEIKSNWGGGTYKLQPRQLAPSGKMVWGNGCVILSIAGEPMLNGRRYVGGVLEEPSAATPAPLPYMMQNPQQANRAGLEGQLLTMVQQTLARAGSPNGTGVDLAGLGTLITSMSGIMGGGGQQQQQGDAMGDMDRAFSLLTKMQKLSGGMGGSESKDDDSDSGFPAGLQQMIMAKIMGGGSQAPQQPQFPPQYAPPPQQNWGPQQPTPPYQQPPTYGQPPQRPNWPAPPAGVPFQQPAQPQHATPPPQPAQPAQPAAPAGPATMDGPAEPAPVSQPMGNDADPFTVAHLEAEMGHMSSGQRDEFVKELMQKLGIDEKLGNLFGGIVPGGAQPPPEAQPEVFPTQSFSMVGEAFTKDE